MLQKDSREFVESLNANGVDYLIVGAHAMAYHGCPRTTGDIDFLIRPEAENSARLVRALADFGFGVAGLSDADFMHEDVVVQLGLPPNRIDILTSITGVSFPEAWEQRVAAELDGLPVNILSRAHLIQNKRALGRAKDLADVEFLLGE